MCPRSTGRPANWARPTIPPLRPACMALPRHWHRKSRAKGSRSIPSHRATSTPTWWQPSPKRSATASSPKSQSAASAKPTKSPRRSSIFAAPIPASSPAHACRSTADSICFDTPEVGMKRPAILLPVAFFLLIEYGSNLNTYGNEAFNRCCCKSRA